MLSALVERDTARQDDGACDEGSQKTSAHRNSPEILVQFAANADRSKRMSGYPDIFL
jgi:hypothetical protein